jgi:hypothetical protein
MAWGEAAACIAKLEAGPEKGSGGRLLEFLKSIADKHCIKLTGMVNAYKADACPEPDQAKTVNFYRKHGFHVGDKSPYALLYPPPDEEPRPAPSSQRVAKSTSAAPVRVSAVRAENTAGTQPFPVGRGCAPASASPVPKPAWPACRAAWTARPLAIAREAGEKRDNFLRSCRRERRHALSKHENEGRTDGCSPVASKLRSGGTGRGRSRLP